MRIFFDMGYSARGTADVTAAELEAFQRVLDKLRATDTHFYGTEDIMLSDTPQLNYTLRVVPAGVRVLTPAMQRAEKQATEETANG